MQVLAPRMKDTDHSEFRPQMLGIPADKPDRFGGCLEQNVVNDSLVLKGDISDLRRYGEDDVEVRHRQQLGPSVL